MGIIDLLLIAAAVAVGVFLGGFALLLLVQMGRDYRY